MFSISYLLEANNFKAIHCYYSTGGQTCVCGLYLLF